MSAPIQPQNQSPQQNSGFSFNVNPSNLASAFSAGLSLMNNVNNIKDKFNPPNRPAPIPASQPVVNQQGGSLPNPLIPK